LIRETYRDNEEERVEREREIEGRYRNDRGREARYREIGRDT